MDTMYDVIIVGAGLAGLRAAYELKDLNIQILEKEKNAGGRILTRYQHGVAYDLGAIFGFDKSHLPFQENTLNLIEESPKIGVFWKGKIYYGSSVVECIQEINLEDDESNQIKKFLVNRAQDVSLLSGSIYNLLNAFFQLIHPGEMRDYMPQRRLDAFQKFNCSHFDSGNGGFIDLFTSRLTPRLHFGTEVSSIEDDGDFVLVFIRDKKIIQMCSKAVICTTPAPISACIIKKMSHPCRTFLNSAQYEKGITVAIGFEKGRFPDFSYIVTPDLQTNTVLKQHTKDDRIQVLYFYYMGQKSAVLKNMTTNQIIYQAIDILRQIGFGNDLEKQVIFSDVYWWPMLSPLITEQSYAKFDPQIIRPSKRVFLAGDYVSVSPQHVMPYGMSAAAISGKNTAEEVNFFLNT
jgi:protoporphyrinogen oxidase